MDAFNAFAADSTFFALPLAVAKGTLQSLPTIRFPDDPQHTFQQALNQLDSVLGPRTVLHLILRHEGLFVAITFVPYAADVGDKTLLLDNRSLLVKSLGEQHFSSSIMCKEVGEVIDTRSWDERSGQGHSWTDHYNEDVDAYGDLEHLDDTVHDLGHKKNKCRLCDRRMQNKIDDAALDALKSLTESGDCVQLVGAHISIFRLSLTIQRP